MVSHYSPNRSPFENGDHPQPARRAHCQERATRATSLGSMLRQLLGGARQDPGPGSSKRVSQADRAPIDVQAVAVDRAQRGIEAKPAAAVVRALPCGQVAEHLACECLMNFIEVKVLKRQPIAPEQAGARIDSSHQ